MSEQKLPPTGTTDSILTKIGEHAGMHAMAGLNSAMLTRPMTADQRAVFAASIHEFNINTASGISVMAGRWNHHLMNTHSPWDATEKGALVLSAAVDEFGLFTSGKAINHAHTLREFTTQLGLTDEGINDSDLVVPAARDLSSHIRETYSTGDLDDAIGLHAASETTAPPEFAGWKEAFLKFPEYGFVEDSESFRYIRDHTRLEVEHAADAQHALSDHLALSGTNPDNVLRGAMIYMKLYGHMATQLTTRIFPEVQPT